MTPSSGPWYRSPELAEVCEVDDLVQTMVREIRASSSVRDVPGGLNYDVVRRDSYSLRISDASTETHGHTFPYRLFASFVIFLSSAVFGAVEVISFLAGYEVLIAALPSLTLMLVGALLTALNLVILTRWWTQKVGGAWHHELQTGERHFVVS